MAIKKGDHVTVDYEGRLENGSVFDGSHMQDPVRYLEVDVGTGMVLEEFDQALIGMEKGEKKEFKILPQNAYGERSDALVYDLPLSIFPAGKPIYPGMVIQLKAPDTGLHFPAKIVAVTPESVSVDFNHPLAGKTLWFTIRIVDVRPTIDL